MTPGRPAPRSAEQDLRDFARLQVRAGLAAEPDQLEAVSSAVRADLPDEPDPTGRAAAWMAEARAELRAEQRAWPSETDFDRLQAAFAELEGLGVVVLQGVDDHWTARDVLAARPLRGAAWFTPSDVWHAIDEGMLEVNLWHGTQANAAPGDELLDEVVAGFAAHGLEAHFDEGRIEVAAHWQRRLA